MQFILFLYPSLSLEQLDLFLNELAEHTVGVKLTNVTDDRINTLIFTVVATAIMVFVTVLAAFAFARLEFKGKNLAFTLFLSLMMIPNELVIITNFVTITDLDLLRQNLEANCIPFETCEMDYTRYEEFLSERRKRMAKKIRDLTRCYARI